MSTQTVSRRVAVTGLASAFAGLAFAQVEDDSVTLEYARKELEAGKATLIDIREPQEHATGVAKGARLLPMRQLAGRVSEIPNDPKTPVLLICNTQNRSSATLKFLLGKGYTNVRYVRGGMSEWSQRGWPLIRP